MNFLDQLKLWQWRRRQAVERRILTALIGQGWMYSLDIMRHTKLRSGRFYPAIGRLENEGMVEATWEEGPYPRRRLYRSVPPWVM